MAETEEQMRMRAKAKAEALFRYEQEQKQAAAPAQDAPEQKSFGQDFAANLTAAANAAFPLADEGAAYVRGGVGGLQELLGAERSYGTVDEELNAIRGGEQQHMKEHPYQAILSSLIGAAATMPAMPSKVATLPTAGQRIGQAALEGAGYGAAYGFGGGEGGVENRVVNAAKSALIGELLGGGVTAATEGASKLIDSTSVNALKQALNVQRSDATKAGKFQGLSSAEDSPLVPALQKAQEKGVFPITGSTKEFIQKNNDEIASIGDEVTGILKKADAAQKDVTIPKFDTAVGYIKEHSIDKDQLTEQLQRRLDWIDKEWDGTISGLNKLKQQIYKKGYKNNTDSQALDKAIGSDIKKYIENKAEELLSSADAQQIKTLNAEQGQHLAIRPLLQKNKFDERAGGLPLALRRLIVSPLGGGALGGYESYKTGDPKYAILGALGGLALTRPGQLAISSLAKSAVPGADKIADASPAITRIIEAIINQPGRQ